MQSQNLEEYKLIRKELESLKICITTYVGFVLGGAGVAILFIGRGMMDANCPPDCPMDLRPLGYAALALSLVVSSVFSILLYKFNSHNRFAGYCKLLTQESLELAAGNAMPSSTISWEICMDRLRKSDVRSVDLSTIATHTEIKGVDRPTIESEVKNRSGRGCAVDKKSTWKGICAFGRLLAGRGVASESWHFPAYIAAAFLMLALMFLLSAFVLLGHLGRWPELTGAWVIWSAVAAYQLLIWVVYTRKLGRLMDGSATVESYCWRFVLVRIAVVEAHLGSNLLSYTLITAR